MFNTAYQGLGQINHRNQTGLGRTIQNALDRFDNSFQQVGLPQRSLNNATDFGVLGSGLNNAVNTGLGGFNNTFQNDYFRRY